MGSLFAGYEGLGLGVSQVLDVELAWVSEIEAAPSAILAHHYLDVPNHGDITAIDWSQVEPVDVLTGGFPCQDVSAAGKRAGLKPGTRTGLWSHMAYAIDQLRPRLVVAENVRGLLSAEAHSEVEPCPWCVGDGPASGLRALGAVLADLAALGYDARWCGLRAADIGAPHGRFRVFIVAWPADTDCASWAEPRSVASRSAKGTPAESIRGAGRDRGAPAADAYGSARGERWLAASGQAEGGRTWPDAGRRGGAPIADATGDGRHEGRPEPTRIKRGSHAAQRSAAADSDSDGLEGLRRIGAIGRDADRRDGEGEAATYADGPALWQQPVAVARSSGETESGQPGSRASADSSGGGRGGRRQSEGTMGPGTGDRRGMVEAAGDRQHASVAWGPYEPAIRRWERTLGRVAPPPTEPGRKGAARLSPRFVEWMQGLDDGWVTDVLGISRNDQLKALGNGVVPQQAAEAMRRLLDLPATREVAA